MEINGKSIPHIEHGGPEWMAEMSDLDKETIIKMFGRKIRECDRYDDIAQEAIGKNMTLTAEKQQVINDGIETGIRRYAWWKDGVQYVGSCGTTLEKALQEHRGRKT